MWFLYSFVRVRVRVRVKVRVRVRAPLGDLLLKNLNF
jgi:hypothetical protein